MEAQISKIGADMEWFTNNYREIAEGRRGKYVAIRDKKIVAESENFDDLLRILAELKIDPCTVFIDSIAPRSFACIL